MSHYDSYGEDYTEYETLFDPIQSDRQARRKRKPKVNHTPKKERHEVIEEIAEADGLEMGFETTYHPGLFEEGWLLDSLRTFYDQKLISDVLGRVKGGKEASVYRCMADSATGDGLLAAKVYRPRMFRNLRNDAMYREGRAVLKENGKAVKNNDHRMMRALGKKTAFGEQLAHTSWLMHEFTTLKTLYALGVPVPKPVAAGTNSILMGYVGDEGIGAPTLHEASPDPNVMRRLFDTVLDAIERMLANGMIHGDLSAYNILYWEGEVVLIDFPQVTDPQTNGNARDILTRDVTRVCDYFASQGVEHDAARIANRLWRQYVEPPSHIQAADLSRYEVTDEDEE
jgi:RIO kinase 1